MKTLLHVLSFLTLPGLLLAQGSRGDTRPDTSLLAAPVASGLKAGQPSAPNSGDERIIAAVRAADDARIAATTAGDANRLGAIFSDELHYAHSNGKIDSKASQIKGITTGGNRYDKFEHKERAFTVAGPNVVIGKGRVIVHMTTRAGASTTLDLNYLSVWRNENGTWRFFAWQSCRNPAPDAAAK